MTKCGYWRLVHLRPPAIEAHPGSRPARAREPEERGSERNAQLDRLEALVKKLVDGGAEVPIRPVLARLLPAAGTSGGANVATRRPA